MVENKGVLIGQKYGLALDDSWTPDLLEVLDEACGDLMKIFSGIVPVWMNGVQVLIDKTIKYGGLTNTGYVRLSPKGLTHWTIVHELAHAWDFSSGCRLSRQMQLATHSSGILFPLSKIFPQKEAFWYVVGSPPPPCGTDGRFNRLEDFAESVTAYVYPEEASKRAAKKKKPYSKWGYATFYETPRGVFIQDLLATVNQNALD